MKPNKEIIKLAILNASLTTFYVMFVGALFYMAPVIFGGIDKKDSIIIPIAMLMLFVFSATLCGALVLGRPILWFLDDKKKEAIKLFSYTLASMMVITGILFVIMYIFG